VVAAGLSMAAHRTALRAIRSFVRDNAAPLLVYALFLLIVSQFTDYYLSRLAALVAFWAAIGMSWNLIGGYAGQLSLGHAAFVGLGGYVALALQQGLGIAPWVGLLPSTVVAALAALAIGVPTLRLSGIYFALATLAYPLILQLLFTYWGYQEALIPAHPESPFLYMQWRDNRWYALIFGTIVVLCWIGTLRLERSRWRYLLTAVREDEAAASAVGVNTWLVKLWAFVTSAAIAGLLGVVYAQMLFVVTPDTMFGIGVSVQALVVTLVGGIGHPAGPLLGTLITVPMAQAFDAQFSSISGAAQLVYGFILIVVILLIPRGLIETLKGVEAPWLKRLGQFFASGAGGEIVLPPAIATVDRSAPAASALPAGGGVFLRAENLSKLYGGVVALKSFSLDVREHEFIGIVGPNGAGKTTLFDLLTGFQRPTAGRLSLRGEDVIGWPPYRLARVGVRRTFQIPRPFGRLSVYENVMLGGMIGAADEAALREAVWTSLHAVELAHLANRTADSLGPSQIRLIEVARALVARPTLLLLDEPLAGLDPSEVTELIEILRRQRAAGVTIVLVDHAISTVAKIVERMVVIDNGLLIGDGQPHEVTRMPQVIEAYLGSKWDHARH
jgi:ABC-type branched-subunit amino acid transport system ATPase component/ABC-type branched-subunit amino acid transport system permease subunit